jgi:adenylosuccinate synthase
VSAARVQVVLGLGFGDEGKGSIVDWLARQADSPPLVVRWNGGPQAQHHVVTDDGRSHCFAQLGAGSFVAGARTHLGPDMAVDPYALCAEAEALAARGIPDPLTSVTIDPRAVLVTPWHAIVNQVREILRGRDRHGSTGRGVGEAKLGAVRVVAGQIGAGFDDEVHRLRRALASEAAALVDAAAGAPEAARALVARAEDGDLAAAFFDSAHRLEPAGVRVTSKVPAARHIILEGAHGALLDQDHGFFPHVTPGRITRSAAEAALRELGLGHSSPEVWGVLRAVHTRHGEGPFPSHDPHLTERLPEAHNPSDGWPGAFRVGWFDGVLARYALRFAGPIDSLALTCLDRVAELEPGFVVEAWETPRVHVGDLSAIPPASRTALAFAAVPQLRAAPDLTRAIAELLDRNIELESWGPVASAKRA